MTDTSVGTEQPSIDEFKAQAREFLEANSTPRPPASEFVWGEGQDDVGLFDEKSREVEAEEAVRAQDWRRKRFDAGFGWAAGPVEHGGRGLTPAYDRAYSSVEAGYITPNMGVFAISLGMVAPTILAHGTPAVRDAYVKGMWRGDIIGCQLFSEPGAGSDLAGVAMRAELDGDEWVLTGQKVWTSTAHLADIGEVICRTDPDMPKHRGLSVFVVDMKAPGVEIRPLRQMTGGAAFNEVFFDEVRVPADHLLGDVNGGWSVALTTLMNERSSIGTGGAGGGGAGLLSPARLHAMLEHFGHEDNQVLRDWAVQLYINHTVAKWNGQRGLEKIKAGELPGPEMSTAKLALTNNLYDYANWAAEVLGPRITADSGEWGTFSYSKLVTGVPGMRVAGGTDEVMRNIVAERVLGMPKDPGIDSKTPFRELPHNQ